MDRSRLSRALPPVALAIAVMAGAVGLAAAPAAAVDPSTTLVLTVTAADDGYAIQPHRYVVKYEDSCYFGNDPVRNTTPGFWCQQVQVAAVTLDADPDTATPASATVTLPNEVRRYVIYTADETHMTVKPTCSQMTDGDAHWPNKMRAWLVGPLTQLTCTMAQKSSDYALTIRQNANSNAGRVPVTWVARVAGVEVARVVLDANPATAIPSRTTLLLPITKSDVVVSPSPRTTVNTLVSLGSMSCAGSLARWNFAGYAGISTIKPTVGAKTTCTFNLGAPPPPPTATTTTTTTTTAMPPG